MYDHDKSPMEWTNLPTDPKCTEIIAPDIGGSRMGKNNRPNKAKWQNSKTRNDAVGIILICVVDRMSPAQRTTLGRLDRRIGSAAFYEPPLRDKE